MRKGEWFLICHGYSDRRELEETAAIFDDIRRYKDINDNDPLPASLVVRDTA